MKITVGKLRKIIRQGLDEAKWLAKPPKKLRDVLEPIEIDAPNSKQAGQQASDRWASEKGARGIDPFSIDLEKLSDDEGGAPSGKKGSPIIFRLGTADKQTVDRIKSKGFEIDDVTGDIVYDPDHWEVSDAMATDEDGFPLDYQGGSKLIPKSPEADKLMDRALQNAKMSGKSAVNIDVIRDVWQGNWDKDVDSVLS